MSMDPYAGSYDWTNPQSFNRFSYAGNNPSSATDPSGLLLNTEGNPGSPFGTPPIGLGSCRVLFVDDASQGCTSITDPMFTESEAEVQHVEHTVYGISDNSPGETIYVGCGGSLLNLDCVLASYSAHLAYNPTDHYFTGDTRLQALAQGVSSEAGRIGSVRGISEFYAASAFGAMSGFVAGDIAAGPEESLLFGRGYYGWTGYLNCNAPWGRYLRIGYRWDGEQTVFRVGERCWTISWIIRIWTFGRQVLGK